MGEKGYKFHSTNAAHDPSDATHLPCVYKTKGVTLFAPASDFPYRPNHRTEPSKPQCRRKMNHFVWTLFVPDCCMTRGKVRKCRVLEITADKAMDGETMASKMYLLILTQLPGGPGGARFSFTSHCQSEKKMFKSCHRSSAP